MAPAAVQYMSFIFYGYNLLVKVGISNRLLMLQLQSWQAAQYADAAQFL